MKTSMRLLPVLTGIVTAAVSAAPLREGEFTRVINDVRILPADSSPVTAQVGARISGRSAVATGAQSRAEIRFSDNTLTRVGANSVFRMDLSSRTVEMDKGVILLQVPKQLGGAKVRTAAVTAAVTGTTILMEFMPDGFIKIIVIEGEVDVSMNERRNQFRTLTSGDMWISKANDKNHLPMPVQVDLERLKKSSKLLSEKEFGPLGNKKQMAAALKDQGDRKDSGELVDTAFQIQGRGRKVGMLLGNRQHIPLGEEQAPVDNKPTTIPGTTVFENQSDVASGNQSYAYNSVFDGFGFLPGSLYQPSLDGPFGEYMFDDSQAFPDIDPLLSQKDAWHVLKFEQLYISGDPSLDIFSGFTNLIMGAIGDINFTSTPPISGTGAVTGDMWTMDSGLDAAVFTSLSGSIGFDGFDLTGTGQDLGFFADGLSSDVNMSASGVEASTVKVSAGRDVKLEKASKLAASGSIQIKARRGVKISNSSQLLRLSQLDNPEVLIEAFDGNVELVDGSSVDADTVNMMSRRGDVQLGNSNIAAREIKARVFDTGGTLLLSNAILGRGTDPSDLIRLYGEASGGVRFVGDTTLKGNIVQIAGKSVVIDPGSRVRLSNPGGTTVYADSHLYNNGINGNFTGLSNSQSGAQPVNVNQAPFGSRPGY